MSKYFDHEITKESKIKVVGIKFPLTSMGLDSSFNPIDKTESAMSVFSNWEKDDRIILFNKLRLQIK